MSTSGWVTSAEPAGSPWPVITLSTPVGSTLGGELGELERRDRRRLGRLQHDRVARRQRRADLPDRHHQRVVPGRDLADHADRLAADDRRVALHVLAGGAALEACAPRPRRSAGCRPSPGSRRSRTASRGLPALSRLEVARAPRRAPRSRRRARSSASARSRRRRLATSRRTPRAPRATARSTSSSRRAAARSAIASPVAGLSTSSVAPSAASTNSPSMKFCSLVLRGRSPSALPPLARWSADGDRRRSRHVAQRGVRQPSASATAGWVTSPAGDVDARAQARVRAAMRALDALVGEREHVGQRRVGERVGRGDRHRARHVRDAVVGDPVDLVGRVGVGRRARGLEAAALVDRHVDEHGARASSAPSCSRVTTCGARAPWTSTAPITRSAQRQHLLDRQRRGVDGRGAAAEAPRRARAGGRSSGRRRTRRPPCRSR